MKYSIFTGGSLAELLDEHKRTGNRFTEAELTQILYQLAQGLRYIHSQNLVHLDIKPGRYSQILYQLAQELLIHILAKFSTP